MTDHQLAVPEGKAGLSLKVTQYQSGTIKLSLQKQRTKALDVSVNKSLPWSTPSPGSWWQTTPSHHLQDALVW